jgi:hypothetical protein
MPQRIAVLTTDRAREAFDYFRPYIVPNAEGNPRWGETEFIYNPEGGSFDGVVVWQSVAPLDRSYTLVAPPSKSLLTIVEPPDVLTLPDGYTLQFAGVLGPDPAVRAQRRFLRGGGHHWFVELPAEEALKRPITDKPRLISTVVSAKKDTKGHRARLGFVSALKEHFGERLDWFGRGIRDIGPRKLNALGEYRYHVVFENGAWPHYWTEKLADAFVANCLPFYWGDPKVSDCFDPAAIVPIDIEDVPGTIRLVERAIAEDWWGQRQEALAEARRRVLADYHPFQVWRECLDALPGSEPKTIVVRPFDQFFFSLRQRIRLRWRRVWKS